MYFCGMDSFIVFKNINIGFSSKGKGSAVVLLHGFLEDASMWDVMAKDLVKKYRVITIDLLGHGKSDCIGYVHSMEEMATIVKVVLENQRIRKVTIIGHSMGGYVGLAFAEKYSKSLKGLCLMNSTAQADTEERQKLRLRAVKMAQINYEALVSMSITNLFVQDVRKYILQEIEDAKKIALRTSNQGYTACTEGMRIRKDRQHILKSANFKKLIIVGKKDPVLNYESIQEEAKRTETPIITLPNGHMSHIENKNELLLAVNSFLKIK